ncbi:MAG: SurA N-terminal domain-containing protein [Planctomycetota bacterium]|nr:SurA N-terminal domain-containing protein [Planctomycetota bacterium]
MRFKYVFLFLFIMGGFALPVFSIAEQAPNKQHWREKVLGTMEGYQLTAAKFARFMIAMGYVEERERLVKEELIHQEAAKRGVAVGSAEVDKALEEYVASFIQQSDADNFTDLLRMNRMTETMVREQVRLRLALKQMVLADTDVKEELIANEIPLWLDKLAANAKIVRYSLKKNQPLVRAASVNDKDISVLALVHELLKRYSDEELGDLLQEVMDYQMVRLHLESIGEPLTEEDLLAEFERLKKEVAEDPQFNGVPLVDILAAQKKSDQVPVQRTGLPTSCDGAQGM